MIKKICPLTEVEKIEDGFIVFLSKHLWIAEAQINFDLEGALKEEFEIPKTFKTEVKAIKYANKISMRMDELYYNKV